MYLAESDESRWATHSPTGRFPTLLTLIEGVRPVPVPQVRDRRIGRDTHTGVEPGKRSRAVRDRAQAHPCREMQEAMAGCDGAGPYVNGHVAVQRGLTGHLEVEDLRAHLDCLDVRGSDGAKGADEARESRAILRRMECLRGSARAILRGGGGR